jgi:serine/threonine protein kinase
MIDEPAPEQLETKRWIELRELFDQALNSGDLARKDVIARTEQTDPELARLLADLLRASDRRMGETADDRERFLGPIVFAPSSAHESGSRIGVYELREKIGSGGMGTVYRAERVDGQIRHEVAIKLVSHRRLDPESLRRFRLEREVVAELEHPNIARMFDVGESDDGSPYLAMELIRGAPITDWCAASKLDTAARLRLFVAVCDAVQHAHSKLILHRDLKPGNVLVTTDGVPKLIDFGISKLLAAEPEQTDLTGTANRFFSPTNAAPEQIKGGNTDVACDVFQLGTLLYELLCGSTVFDPRGLTASELERQILEVEPIAPSRVAEKAAAAVAHAHGASDGRALARSLKGDLDSITTKALRKLPSERYASAQRLADDVRNYLSQRPVEARRGRWWYRTRKFAARHRWSAMSGALALAAVVAFVAALSAQSQRVLRERDAARQERDRADEVSNFLAAIFKSADPNESLTREMPIGRILDNGKIRIEHELKKDPLLRARLLGTMSTAYLNLSDSDTALELLADEHAALSGSAVPNDRLWVEYWLRRGQTLANRGDYDGAASAADRAIALQTELGDSPGRRWAARSLRIETTKDKIDGETTVKDLRALVADMRADPTIDNRDIASVQLQLGHAMVGVFEHEEAEGIVRDAIARLGSTLPPNHPEVLDAQRVLADLLDYGLGRSEEAKKILLDVVAKQERIYGERSIGVATTLVYLGGAETSLEQYQDAIATYERAERIFREVRGDTHPDLMAVQINAADVYARIGDLDRAGALQQKALVIAERHYGRDGENTAFIRSRLGKLRLEQGRSEEALSLLRSAVNVLGYESVNRVNSVIDYAEALHRLGRDADAKRELDKIDATLDEHAEKLKDEARRVAALRAGIAEYR